MVKVLGIFRVRDIDNAGTTGLDLSGQQIPALGLRVVSDVGNIPAVLLVNLPFVRGASLQVVMANQAHVLALGLRSRQISRLCRQDARHKAKPEQHCQNSHQPG